MNRKKYNFWMRLKSFVEGKCREAYMEGGNCDSSCPKCKQSESLGNIITNEDGEGSVKRACGNCGHRWRAIFMPFGFMEVSDEK